jgi:hypothetical protein
VQGHLLEQGLARAYTLGGNRSCAAALLSAERRAREAHRGLWAQAAYQLRSADNPAELLRYRSTFQIIEGWIAKVARVRGVIYLNFDPDWRRGFSVSVRAGNSDILGAYAKRPRSLAGKAVRVRGWIDQRHGAPTIDLSVAGQLEVLDSRVTEEGKSLQGERRDISPSVPSSWADMPGVIETGQ